MIRQFQKKDDVPKGPRSKPARKGIRLFKVRLAYDCDDGGALHVPSDKPLWCLRTQDREGFVRAISRSEAAKIFQEAHGFDLSELSRKNNI